MSSHTSAELKFTNEYEANSCIDKVNNKKDECGLTVSINRSLICKGVVADWPDSNSNVNMIRKLWDAIDDKSDIVRLEKML